LALGSITRELTCHPDTPVSSIDAITVHVQRSASGRLWLRYHAEVLLHALALPAPAEPSRTDGLWKATCFELFMRVPGQPDYAEFNFSPSSQWAAYHFGCYRETMRALDVDNAPDIGLDASETHFALEAVAGLPVAWRAELLEIALCAVIEETDGTKSYWAIQHPPGPPDFHHPDCFALTLAAPD
jgi:hypothetical protein